MKAFKVDGLVVSCTDAPKGDKDLIREKAVNMAYFSKKKEGYSHTCSEMEAVALAAERDGLGLHVLPRLPMELHWLPEAEERLDRLLSPLLGRIAACSAAGIHESQCQRTPHGQACRA